MQLIFNDQAVCENKKKTYWKLLDSKIFVAMLVEVFKGEARNSAFSFQRTEEKTSMGWIF